jgi:hypothetical protein
VTKEKQCFIIAPVGAENSATRQRFNELYSYIIQPVCESLGYTPVSAHTVAETGLITNQIITLLLEASLVIADLHGHNPNVFYELGIRHATGKPFVQMIDTEESLPFDIAGIRTVHIESGLGGPDRTKEALRKHIAAFQEKGSGETENPISLAVDVGHLRRSDNATERSIAEVVAAVAETKAYIAKIERLLARDRGTARDAESENEGGKYEIFFQMPFWAYENLRKLATDKFGEYRMSSVFANELRQLRQIGYVDVASVSSIPPHGKNLSDHVAITARGRDFVRQVQALSSREEESER